MQIRNNVGAMFAAHQLANADKALAGTLKQLSSGLRINSGGDDAAGLAVSEKIRTQVFGSDQARRNVRDAVSMMQTTEAALEETFNMVQRMRVLAVQAANGTLTDADRALLEREVQGLSREIDRVATGLDWNGRRMLENYLENITPVPTNAVETGYLVGDVAAGTHRVDMLQAAERHIIETRLPWEVIHERDTFLQHSAAAGTPTYNTGQIDFHAAINDKTQVGILDEVWSVERAGAEFLLDDETTAQPEWVWLDDATGGILTIPGTSATNSAIEFDSFVAPAQQAAFTFNIENAADGTAVTLPIRNGSLVIRDGDGHAQAITAGSTFYNTDTDMTAEMLATGGVTYGFTDWQTATDEAVAPTGPWAFTVANNGYDITFNGANPVTQDNAQVFNAGQAPATQTGYVKNTVSGALQAFTATAADRVSISAGVTNELSVTAVRYWGEDVAGEVVALADTSALPGQRGTFNLANANLSNAAQTGAGAAGNSSVVFTGGVLTNAVAGVAAVLNDGDYYVDHTTGQVTYKLTTGPAAESANYAHRRDFAIPAEFGATDEANGDFTMAAPVFNAGDTVYASYSYVSGVTLNAPGRNGGTIDLIGAGAVNDSGGPLVNGVDYSYNNATGALTYLTDNAGGLQVDYDYNVTYSTTGAAINSATGAITISAAQNAGRPALDAGGTVRVDYRWQDDQANFLTLAAPSSYGGDKMIKSVTVNGLPGGVNVTGFNAATGVVTFDGIVDPGTLSVDYTYRARYTVNAIDYVNGTVSTTNPGDNTPDPTSAGNLGDYTFDYDWYHTVRIGYYQLDYYPMNEDGFYVARDLSGNGAFGPGDVNLTAGAAAGQYIRDLGGIRLNGQAAVDPDPDYDGTMENQAIGIDYIRDVTQVIDTHAGGQLDRSLTTIGEPVPTVPGDAGNNDGLFNDFWGTDMLAFTCDGVRVDVQVRGTDTVADLIGRINARADEEGCRITAEFNEATQQLRIFADEEGTRYRITVNDETFGPEDPAGNPKSSLNFTTVQEPVNPVVRVTTAQGAVSTRTSDSNYFDVTNSGIAGAAFNLADEAEAGWEAWLRLNAVTFHTGANADQIQDVTFRDMRAASLTVDRMHVSTQAEAEAAIGTADTALKIVTDYRAFLGAVQQTLEARSNFLGVAGEQQQTADARIRDVDIGEAVMRQTKGQIMVQSTQAFLAQANVRAEAVLRLIG